MKKHLAVLTLLLMTLENPVIAAPTVQEFTTAVAENNQARVAQYLNDGYAPNTQDIAVAIVKKNPSLLELLLSTGFNPNLRFMDSTPLLLAVSISDQQIAEILIKHGAIVDAVGKDGFTPLMLATMNNDLPMVELLLSYGANPSVQMKDGVTARTLANNRKNTKIIQLLQSHMKDTNDQLPTPDVFIRAIMTGNETAVAQMLKKMPLLANYRYNGSTPLFIAASGDHVGIVKMLLDKKANIDATVNGVTPLMAAVAERNTENVKLLLDYGADPDIQEWSGMNAKMLAENNNDPVSLKYLEDAIKANPKQHTPLDQNPLRFVRVNKNKNTISYIDKQSIQILKKDGPVLELTVDYYDMALDGKPSFCYRKKYVCNTETKKVSLQDLTYCACDAAGNKLKEYDADDHSIRELQDLEPEYKSINFVVAAATGHGFFDDKDLAILNWK
ncbi:ankyrin repeat domain-containing protein [Acidaminococcus timonensis]|uniref:ankyrin repeat domain-containing protein n=1 Tax=Acidaminococcus timonensis TaxID=1871002 RepID=UPI0026F1C6A4|nr:ankyrin repeat domain-containing protein [Acidaminococcus timonensis]